MSKLDRLLCMLALIAALALLLSACGPRPDVVQVVAVATPEASPDPAEKTRSAAESAPAYVLNPETLRFHLPGCSWAEKINPDRRIEYSGSRETLLEVGYRPCHYCKP